MAKQQKKSKDFKDTRSRKSNGQKQQKFDNRNSNDTARGVDRSNGDNCKANGFMGRENDPSWYNVLNTLVNDVTKIPFGNQIGRVYPLNYSSPDVNELDVPGIMALDYLIGPGLAKTASDGVNIAATSMFQQIRKKLSTVGAYASADVMMRILAMDSVIVMYNYILRMFGTVNLFSSINYNYGKALLTAEGLNEEGINDFKRNLGIYIARFNSLVYKASTLYMPQEFSIIKRHAWLFSNIFIDGKDAKSQIYLHRPSVLYILNETESEQGTLLAPTPLNYGEVPGVHTMDELLETFDQMIEAIRNSDSMNKIAADMQRAFEGSPVWSFSYVTPDYVVSPTYSEEVLSQIENTTICPLCEWTSLPVSQSVDKNIILWDPQFEGSLYNTSDEFTSAVAVDAPMWDRTPNALWFSRHILNFHWANPSSDDIAVATRNMVTLYPTGSSGALKASSLGSDVCVGCHIYKYRTDIDTVEVTNYFKYMPFNAAYKDGLNTLGVTDYLAFDWAPIIYAASFTEKNVLTGASPICDFSNFTILDPEVLDQMHNNIITSMWSVPQFGTN